MKKKINKVIFPLVSLIVFLFLFLIINKALAAGDYGLSQTITAGNLSAPFNVQSVTSQGAGQFLSSKFGAIVGSIISFVGVFLLVLVIFAGFLWMTAAGNEKKTEQAKNILISAVIGLIIILSAYAITAFIGRQLTDTGALPAQPGTDAGQGNVTETVQINTQSGGCSSATDVCVPDNLKCETGQFCNDACACEAITSCENDPMAQCVNSFECEDEFGPGMVCDPNACECVSNF